MTTAAPAVLRQMQHLLARLYDTPVDHEVGDFLITDRRLAVVNKGSDVLTDEQLLIAESGEGVERSMHIALYIDHDVLMRLERHNPFDKLEARNLADFCTALEGVSHFHYVVWCCALLRPVSLLELELQAEVDKYAGALRLLTSQRGGLFPPTLHRDLFERVSFAPGLDADSLNRYRVANRHAAKFCRDLEQRFLRSRRVRVEAWLEAIRRFYRLGHAAKLRQVSYA